MQEIKYVHFTIPGEPRGKQRPRVIRARGKSITYTPEQTVIYENLVKVQYKAAAGDFRFDDDAVLSVVIMAYYFIPKSVSKLKREKMVCRRIRPTKKPDVDNICKIVTDALNGIAYRDDSQIVECCIKKYYSETPCVDVIIQEVQQ